ncbi:hypothetical protein ACFSQ7_46580 [Paenibacillus rhizoplanae]
MHGESGVRDWLDMMADDFFYDVSAEHKAAIYQAVEDQLRPEHYRQGQSIADYRRLRVCAVKQAD